MKSRVYYYKVSLSYSIHILKHTRLLKNENDIAFFASIQQNRQYIIQFQCNLLSQEALVGLDLLPHNWWLFF